MVDQPRRNACSRLAGRQPRAAVVDLQHEQASSIRTFDRDLAAAGSDSTAASMALSIRLPSIVTASCWSIGRPVTSAAVGDRQLARRARRPAAVLPSSKAAMTGSSTDADHPVGERLGDCELGGGEVDRVARAAHLDQRDHRVQPVRGLVGLRAQRLGEAADGVQLAGQTAWSSVWSRRVMTVPERRGPPSGPAPGVDDQHRVVDEMDLVGRASARRAARATSAVGQAELGHAAGRPRVAGQAEQPPRLVVDQLHPALGVEQQQPLAHGVQHRVVVLVHPGDLALAQAVGLPAQPPADQPGAEQRRCRAAGRRRERRWRQPGRRARPDALAR